MKKLLAKYRCIDYTSDGCTAYQCLACKQTWEARSTGYNFCGYCGIKFDGEHAWKPKTRYECRKTPTMGWTLQARRLCDDPEYQTACIGWTPISRIMCGARHALRALRGYRKQAAADLIEDPPFLPTRNEFRLVYTDDEAVNWGSSWVKYPLRIYMDDSK